MGKMTFRGKIVVAFICVISLGILLYGTYFIMQRSSSDNVDASHGYSDDFNFLLYFNTYGREQIDTYRGTFTKDLVIDGTKTVKFNIPDNVKKDIYNMMMDIKIMSFPDTLKVDGISVKPSCDYKLTVTINGKTKSIVWKEGFFTSMTDNLPKDNVKFLELVKYISDYIYSTEEYSKMPEANGGYD